MINKFKKKLKQDVHFSELIKGSTGAFLFRLLGMLLGYVFLLLIARNYGAEGSGLFALALTFVSIGALLAKGGIDIITMRNVSRHSLVDSPEIIKGYYLQGLSLVLGLSLTVTLFFSVFSTAIAEDLFDNPRLSNIFFWCAFLIIPLTLIQFHAEALRGLKLVSAYSFLIITSVYLFSILLILSGLPFGITDVLYIDSFYIAHVITLLIAILMWISSSNLLKVKSRYIEKYTEVLKASLPIMMTGSVFLVMGWTDIIMLGMYSTEENVGVYNIALKLAAVTTLSLIAINSIVAPKIAKMHAENKQKEMSEFIQQATKLIFFTALPILIINIVFPELILSFFGVEFLVGTTTLIILTVGQFVSATSGPVGQILNMTGNQKILMNTGVIAAITNIVLNYSLIPSYGIEGAAFSTAFSGILWNLLCVFYIYKKLNILVFYIPGFKSGKNLPVIK